MRQQDARPRDFQSERVNLVNEKEAVKNARLRDFQLERVNLVNEKDAGKNSILLDIVVIVVSVRLLEQRFSLCP